MTVLLLVSMQNVSQFRVSDLTRGTLFFTAVLTSEEIFQKSETSTQGIMTARQYLLSQKKTLAGEWGLHKQKKLCHEEKPYFLHSNICHVKGE